MPNVITYMKRQNNNALKKKKREINKEEQMKHVNKKTKIKIK